LHDSQRPVLIVDTYESTRRIARALLAHLGYADVEEAADESAAFEKLRERRFSLVMSGLSVASEAGIAFLRAVRSHALLKSTPVIVMTANADQEPILAAQAAGATGYIVKPLTAPDLKRKIDAALAA